MNCLLKENCSPFECMYMRFQCKCCVQVESSTTQQKDHSAHFEPANGWVGSTLVEPASCAGLKKTIPCRSCIMVLMMEWYEFHIWYLVFNEGFEWRASKNDQLTFFSDWMSFLTQNCRVFLWKLNHIAQKWMYALLLDYNH